MPARTPEEEVDTALAIHQANGLIRSWERAGGTWTVRMTNGQPACLVTVREATVFCWGLSSAHQAARRL